MNDSDETDTDHVVTAFLRRRGKALLLCRSDTVDTHRGMWGGVSGFPEGDPDEQVVAEIRDETGLEETDVSFVRAGRPVEVADEDTAREWVVHPFLFDCDDPDIELSEEHDEYAWLPATTILEAVGEDLETVPTLWTAYERVAPTVRSITADDEHGAATLSIRALEVLRDRAGVLVAERDEFGVDPEGERDELAELAGRLLEARPAMAVLRNRVNRVMAEADLDDGASAVLESTLEGIDRALAADDEAAATASEVIDGTVLTLSRSSTVGDTLRQGDPSRVFVAESRPAREGVDVAEELAADLECPVTVHTDAAVAHVLEREAVDRVLVGADTIRPDGAVVNKTGTRAAALAASHEAVPVTVVAATDKVSTREEHNLESGDRAAVYDGDTALDVLNPTFDVTPPAVVDAVAAERGLLEDDGIEDVVAELRDLESW
ncbi:NUDIX domain-containing protein [Natronobacterium gregoryi]|uniref:Initiation factor 2B n=2 Tax=Natronobacterium gregoryi TaxID=44930 RepID=L0AJ40_NATGS|nr:NUDIX domain-containing protein [Natronobacterium gregoryi]AFZ73464.1 translation initiation factor 2B subunit, eIF-2B alpha/beta/delta family [Natronobacterium gregoryi SP2]ELY68661.1 initiation factor 2B related protein [Natronobacterium gregoryi SP2]PLK20520.1 initiation factor 2B [Natronobacterium gregoryi SP2]SFI71353.1 Translation initiation factor 2B subunit, eIF-2B alpha/beta/delta family [Natronobacterium gregoryi]